LRLRPVSAWRDEPFSYSKVWLALSVWFGFATVPLGQYDLGHVEYSGLILWLVVNLCFQKLVKPGVWSSLSPRLREAIPYDREEALKGKGVIHSYRDLWGWFRNPASRS
jgi:hypothetical protein